MVKRNLIVKLVTICKFIGHKDVMVLLTHQGEMQGDEMGSTAGSVTNEG